MYSCGGADHTDPPNREVPAEINQDMSMIKRAYSCGGFGGAPSLAGIANDEIRDDTHENEQHDLAQQQRQVYGSPHADVRDGVSEERDFDVDSTELFAAIHRRAWKNASLWCKNEPEQAKIWIYRRRTEDGEDYGIRWKTLPLHAAIMFKAPFTLIEELLRAYCPAVSLKDDKGMLPIHLALKVGAAKANVRVLLDAYPESVDQADDSGALPLDLAKSSNSPFRKAYLNAWASTFYALHNECDFDTNPTKLYMYLQRKDWTKEMLPEISKADAATWVSRREEMGSSVRWRMLPLHAAILFQAPDQVIQSVLRAHPPAAKCRDDRGMLPLHVALAKRLSDSVVTQLLRAYPESIITPDNDGVYPIEVARASKSPFRDEYIEALERDPSFYKLNDECDFDTNPTSLYLSIEDGNSEVTEYIAGTSPEEARTWVSKRSKSSGKLKWRMLPLHAAILFSAPLATVCALVQAYPDGASCRDSQGMLPIHTALKNGLSVEIVEFLLMHYPHCLIDQDAKGRTPFTLAEGSKSQHKDAYVAALERGPSYYVRQKELAEKLAGAGAAEQQPEIAAIPSEKSFGPGPGAAEQQGAYPLISSVTMDRKPSLVNTTQKSFGDGITSNETEERNVAGGFNTSPPDMNGWHSSSPPIPQRSSLKDDSTGHLDTQQMQQNSWHNSPPIAQRNSLKDESIGRHRSQQMQQNERHQNSPPITRRSSLKDESTRHYPTQQNEHRSDRDDNPSALPRTSSLKDTGSRSRRHSEKHGKSSRRHAGGHHDSDVFIGKSIVGIPSHRSETREHPAENSRGGATSPTHSNLRDGAASPIHSSSSRIDASLSSPHHQQDPTSSNPISATANSPTNQGDTPKHKVRKIMSKVFTRGNNRKSKPNQQLNSAPSRDEGHEREEAATNGDGPLAYTKSYDDGLRSGTLEPSIKGAESTDDGLRASSREPNNKGTSTPDGGLISRPSMDQGVNADAKNQYRGLENNEGKKHAQGGNNRVANEGKPIRGAPRKAKGNKGAGKIPRNISPWISTAQNNGDSQPEELEHVVSDLTDPSDIQRMQRSQSHQGTQKPVSILRPQRRGGPGAPVETVPPVETEISTNAQHQPEREKFSMPSIANIPGLSLLSTVDTFAEKHDETVGTSKSMERPDDMQEQEEDERKEGEDSPHTALEDTNEAAITTPSRRLVMKTGMSKGKHGKTKDNNRNHHHTEQTEDVGTKSPSPSFRRLARSTSPSPKRKTVDSKRKKKKSAIDNVSESSTGETAAGPGEEERLDERPPLGRRPSLKVFGGRERRRSPKRAPPEDIPLVISMSSDEDGMPPSHAKVQTGLSKSSLRSKRSMIDQSEFQEGLEENPTSLSIDTMNDVKNTMAILDKHAAKHGVSRSDIIARIGRNGPQLEDSTDRNGGQQFEDSIAHTMSEGSTITTEFRGEGGEGTQKKQSVGQTLDSALDKVGEALFENDLMNGLVSMVVPSRRNGAAGAATAAATTVAQDGEASVGVSGVQSRGDLSSPATFVLNETGPRAKQSS